MTVSCVWLSIQGIEAVSWLVLLQTLRQFMNGVLPRHSLPAKLIVLYEHFFELAL